MTPAGGVLPKVKAVQTPQGSPPAIYAWKRFSQSSHLTAFSTALQYFLHVRHWNLGPGFISISPAKIIRINKFVPFEGLKLRNP